jgi:metallophosphoesterase superfamily enzyme
MSPQERIVAASYETHDHRRLITRGDALAILGRSHPAREVVDAYACIRGSRERLT